MVRQMIEYLYTLDYKADVSPPKPAVAPAAQQECSNVAEINNGGPGKETSPHSHKDSEEDQELKSQPPETPETSGDITRPLIFHILMYSLADRMMINGLKALACENVKAELLVNFEPKEFPNAIRTIYQSTPRSDRELRNLAAFTTMQNLDSLRPCGKKTQSIFNREFFVSVPHFPLDLLESILDSETLRAYLPIQGRSTYRYRP